MNPKRITVLALGLAMALTWFVSSSVFGCFFNDGESCAVFSLANPAPPPQNAPANLATGPDQELARLQKDLVAFVQEKLGLGEAKSTRELVQLMQLLPQKSDAELAQWLAQAKLLDTGNSPLHTRRIELLRQEQTRRQNERLAQKLAQQEAARQAAARRAAAQSVSAVPAPVIPGSLDPYNAPAPSGTQAYINPRSSVWYSANDRGRRLSIWMNANHQGGLEVAIYAPDQADVWNTRPIGVAAPGQGFDFFWTGRSRMKGTYRIRVTNLNDFSVPYTLGAQAVSDKNGDLCKDCHGNIEDEWDRCEHDGSFCEDLKDQYKN